MLPEVLEEVVEKLKAFPGLGTRSSRKLALDILDLEQDQYTEWVAAMTKMRSEIQFCERCGFFASRDKTESAILCSLCRDSRRNPRQICVVEKPTDILLLERSENYRGQYFVLGGLISPLDNVFAEDTHINELFATRIPQTETKPEEDIEIILFFRPSFNADATTAYLKEKIALIQNKVIKLSKLAQGLPLYYNPDTLDQATMSLALSDRREV